MALRLMPASVRLTLTAAARSVLLAGIDPNNPHRRAIVQTKSNLAPHGPAVGFALEGGQFYWTRESDITAQGILSQAADESDVSRLDEAMNFLREALAEGEREVKEVSAEAKHCGIVNQTLRRARERLRIKTRREGAPNTKQRFYWSLPCDAVQDGGDDVH